MNFTSIIAYIRLHRKVAGMDAEGLRQYFCIGSDEKVLRSLSPRLTRQSKLLKDAFADFIEKP